MKNPDMQQFGLRVERELFQKFRYVADYEGRSANRDLVQYIKRKVRKFEQENGPIILPENDPIDPETAGSPPLPCRFSPFWGDFVKKYRFPCKFPKERL